MSKELNAVEEKMAYEKPAVIHRQVMESIAGACSDQDPATGKEDAPCTTINS